MEYTTAISESIVRDIADELVSGGYRDRGFSYVCIDDGWSTSRDPVTNELRADPVKFPSGIPALVDYVHAAGLKFGIYADVGSATCSGYSGLGMDANLTSKQYIADVATFARWGVDALKVDGCYQDPSIMHITYPALSDAINASGHAMWLSCSWPCYVGGCGGGPAKVDAAVYATLQQKCNTWRDFNDMYDNQDSLYNIIGAYTNPAAIAKHNAVVQPGAFNDADMLAAGGGGLSTSLEEMQMVMWAMLSSPLIMSNDLPNIPAETKALLLNSELIAVNQDTAHASSFNSESARLKSCPPGAFHTRALPPLQQHARASNATLTPRTHPRTPFLPHPSHGRSHLLQGPLWRRHCTGGHSSKLAGAASQHHPLPRPHCNILPLGQLPGHGACWGVAVGLSGRAAGAGSGARCGCGLPCGAARVLPGGGHAYRSALDCIFLLLLLFCFSRKALLFNRVPGVTGCNPVVRE